MATEHSEHSQHAEQAEQSEQSEDAIRASIVATREALARRVGEDWPRMLADWAADGPDAVWLMYSANYLFRTAGVRWAVDPVTLNNKVPDAAQSSIAPLESLRFFLMTHNHSDHVDHALLRELACMDVQWVVPAHMRKVAANAGAPERRIIAIAPGETIEIDGVRVTAFEGMHWERRPEGDGRGEAVAGIDATSYYVQAGDQRLLLPGDTRTYDPRVLPAFEADTTFAHVWLGRGSATLHEPPLLEPFCAFVEAMRPRRRVVLAHLWQVARGPGDYWDTRHADLVKQRLAPRLPDGPDGVEVTIPPFWQRVAL